MADELERLTADAERLAVRILEQRVALAALEVERDALVRELRSAGVAERAVGRLFGVSGPRVHQIVRAAKGGEQSAKGPERPAKPAKSRAKAAERTDAPAKSPERPAVVPGPVPTGLAPVPPRPRRCTHPGTRVVGGFCKQCDALVSPGGGIRG